jgi:hypothetical protein
VTFSASASGMNLTEGSLWSFRRVVSCAILRDARRNIHHGDA